MNRNTRKTKSRKKLLIAIASILVVLSLLVFSLEKRGVIDLYSGNPPQTTEPEDINFDPPTPQEQQAGDDQKQETEQKEAARNNPDNQNKSGATVIITDAGQYDDVIEVRAFTPDHYEDGTCIISLKLGAAIISKSTPAYRDVSTTICTNPLFQRSEFSSGGEWEVTVQYESPSAKGTSAPQKVVIQ